MTDAGEPTEPVVTTSAPVNPPIPSLLPEDLQILEDAIKEYVWGTPQDDALWKSRLETAFFWLFGFAVEPNYHRARAVLTNLARIFDLDLPPEPSGGEQPR